MYQRNGGLRNPLLIKFRFHKPFPRDQISADPGGCGHASCTCMMGTHAMSVVGSELRMHGLDALRVIDASVMPAVTSTNTNAPTIIIAEKGAALMKEEVRQRLAA